MCEKMATHSVIGLLLLLVPVNPCNITFSKPAAVREGNTVRLSCSTETSCRSYLKIESVPPSGLETSQSSVRDPATANFTASRSDDGREFTCQTRGNKDPQFVKKITISVWYKPRNTNIEIVGQTTGVAVGRTMVFKCNTDANPPPGIFYWFTHRGFHQRYPSTGENSLELRDVTTADQGCYRCRADNSIGSGDLSTDLCINVLYPPSNLVLSMATEVTEGQRVSISCGVDSSPAADLTLSRTSQGSTAELKKTTGQNSLSFSVTVSSAHSGQYNCSAHNSVGSESTQRSLRVMYGPEEVRVQADPGLIVTENMTLRLHCSTHSDPPVSSVTWSRVTAGQELHVHTGADYTVKSVSVNHSGHYSCTAHNSIGQGTSPRAEVQVHFGPNVVVLRAEEEQGSDGSRTVTLSCSSHSFPPVSSYTWYRSTEGGVTKVSENINYTVLSTQPGVYYCTAKNEVSESTSEPVSLFLQENYLKFISPALKLVLIVLLPIFIYRLAKDLQNKSKALESSDKCMVGRRNRSSRSKPTQRQGLSPEDSFCEETAIYENTREEQVNIDVGQAQVTFRTTAPVEEGQQ